jgi:radical SAM superfamily enzyme YgiQ (UPF0313 family)
MRVLLVNPPAHPAIRGILPPRVEFSRGAFPPLGILYLAAALRRAVPDTVVQAIDAPTSGESAQEIARYAGKGSFDLVGISVMTFTLLGAVETAAEIMRLRPRIPVVAGGPHAHLYPAETLQLGLFDWVLRGEAEDTFPELVRRIMEKEELKGLAGLGEAPCPELIFKLDELPFPARDLLPVEAYYSVLSGLRPITTLMSSRGCPYPCVFCDRPHLGKHFRSRSAKNVVDEMEECAGLGIREIVFYDDNLTHQRDRVREMAELILERKLPLSWDARARVGDLDAETYQLCARAGLRRIHFGVETGDPELLRLLRKGITHQQARQAFEESRAAGIETLAYFMIGIPGETEGTLSRTLQFARELEPDYIHFSILIPFPGTPVYAMGQERGIIPGDPWRDFARDPRPDFEPPLWIENLSAQELRRALRKLYRRFYLRPGYLLRRTARLRSLHQLRANLRMGLSILGLRS